MSPNRLFCVLSYESNMVTYISLNWSTVARTKACTKFSCVGSESANLWADPYLLGCKNTLGEIIIIIDNILVYLIRRER